VSGAAGTRAPRRLRVAYVYANPRHELAAAIRAGSAPDSHLLAVNHLARFRIDARVHDPALDSLGRGLPDRLRWHLREVTLPWELRDADVLFTPLSNIVPLTSRLRGRRPRVVVFNFGLNTTLRRAGRARRALLVAALRRAAGVVSLGPSQRDELAELSGLDGAHAQTVVLGVDHEYFTPSSVSPEPLVVAVGKDIARDYRTLAEAARRVDARFVFVVLQRNLVGVELPPNVEVRERIPFEELRALYESASCAVVALRKPGYRFGTEGSGVSALLESMAMGLPLVASDRPIIRDYLPKECGLIVPPENPAALAEALTWVLGDPARAAEMGRASRRTIERRHTMDDMAADLAPKLEAAAEDGSRGASSASATLPSG
jgi:glycosyltransferase involved in cell wall biosynthesis